MQIWEMVALWIVYGVSLYFSIFLILVFLDARSRFEGEEYSTDLQEYPQVTVVVPAYNEEKTIEGTMQSVFEIDYPQDKLDVILVNDGSQDATLSLMRRFVAEKNAAHFRIMTHENMGKAASMNKALHTAEGKYFACLDADSFVDPLSLRRMLALYEREADPRLAIVTPAMKVSSPKGFLQKIQWFEYLVMILVGRLTSHLDSLYVAPGPFSLYRRDLVLGLGGFADDTLAEDQEIAYRMQDKHYRIKHCNEAYVHTVAPDKVVEFYKQRRRWFMGSMQCVYKYRHLVADKNYGDFGVLQMVKNIVGYGLALAGIGFAGYFMLWPLVDRLIQGWVIGFDFWPYLKELKFMMTPVFLDMQKGVILLMLFMISGFFFWQAHYNGKEKINAAYYASIIPYFAFYYLLKGGILVLSIMEFARLKKIKW